MAPSAGLAQQPIRIGATMALTGESSIQGGYSREGYLLCQKHVNEKGGVLGRQIELVIYDDASNGRTAAGLYEKLFVEDKVDAALGWEKGRRYLIMVTAPAEGLAEASSISRRARGSRPSR